MQPVEIGDALVVLRYFMRPVPAGPKRETPGFQTIERFGNQVGMFSHRVLSLSYRSCILLGGDQYAFRWILRGFRIFQIEKHTLDYAYAFLKDTGAYRGLKEEYVQYSTVLMFSILSAGAIGGVASYLGAGGDADPVGAVIHEARSSLRDKMREMDNSYYRRGEAYEACANAYGGRMAGKLANGEITLTCECFDRSTDLLRGLDRETALKALGPGPDTDPGEKIRITVAANRVLNHCDIEPWTGGPAVPIVELRNKDRVAASESPKKATAQPFSEGLRGSY